MKSVVNIYVFALVIMVSLGGFTYADNVEIKLGSGDGFKVQDSNGLALMDILSNGNLGIGNTNPSYELDVSGDINFTGSLYQNGSIYGGGGGGSSAWTTSGSDIYYNSGNVGIGTTAPDNRLHVMESDAGALSYREAVMTIEKNGEAALQFLTPNDQIAMIGFGDPQSNYAGAIEYSHYHDDMRFVTNGNYAMRINSNGNVGINISQGFPSTADAKLELVGDFMISATDNGDGDRFIVNSSGNVGIGTTSPGVKLDIVGSIRVDGDEGGAANTVTFTDIIDTGGTYITTGEFLKVYIGTTVRYIQLSRK